MSGAPKVVPLWHPTAATLEASNLTRFSRTLGLPFAGAPGEPDSSYDFMGLHQWSIDHRDAFWSGIWQHCGLIGDPGARALVDGENMLRSQFFPDATLNFAENLLTNDLPDSQTALIERTENGERKTLNWGELRSTTDALARRLQSLGIQPGDRVAAALPNGFAAALAMLATTKLGAIWCSCSPDFGVEAMVDRFAQISPKLLLGCRSYSYGGKAFHCLSKLNQVANQLDTVSRLVLNPLEQLPANAQSEPLPYTPMPFAAPAFILFSSGTTGAPKCIVHSIGGTLLKHRSEHSLHCNLGPEDRLMFFTTCGWMMWNWLLGALAGGTALVLYDGSPFYPRPEALLEIAHEERLSHLGISPGYLSALAKQNVDVKGTHPDLALKCLLSTGSVLPDDSYHWVAEQFGPQVQLASISGGTDILGCFALGNPWQPVVAGEIQGPALGVALKFVDDNGNSLIDGKGELVCSRSIPSQPVGFWNDDQDEKYRAAYFARFPNAWHHGDYGEINTRGGVRIHGRSDAVLNRGGVRIGTAEIYRQLEPVKEVAECVAVAQKHNHDSRILLFVRLQTGELLDEALTGRIQHAIRTGTSPRHLPDFVLQVGDIPRTRSGKIVELAIAAIINGESVKNTGAIANPEALTEYERFAELKLG